MDALLEMKNINKRFPGVHALQDVSFDVKPGEVHALVGENGAGKSTLIKVISGAHDFESGEYIYDGKAYAIKTPKEAIDLGIAVIYQELNLSETLSVAENVFYNRLPNKRGKVLWKKLHEDTTEVLGQLNFAVNPKRMVSTLSIAQKQLVEIGKALTTNARIIIMDEPTSSLTPKEISALFNVIRLLRERGIGIVYVSHKMNEIMEISDRVTVLRDGQYIATVRTGQTDEQKIVAMMVGRDVPDVYIRKESKIGEVALEVRNITNYKLKDISFTAHRGEILGFSGLIGAGRTELAYAIMGYDKRSAGKVLVDGREVPPNSTSAAKKAGIGMIPEDRKNLGLFLNMTVRENVSIAALDKISKRSVVSKKLEKEHVARVTDRLRVKTPSLEQLVQKLSGGNQQKCVVSRWLMAEGTSILLVDEPTRGIDVGAKTEIYEILEQLTLEGMVIIMMSSELAEIMSVCDRVYVMREGRITREFMRGKATQEEIIQSAI